MADFVDDATANAMLDAAISGTVYLGLYDGDPQGAGAEISGNGYARAMITFAAAAARRKASNMQADFPSPSAAWGVVTHGALFAEEAGGTPFLGGEWDEAKTIGLGDTVKVSSGSLALSMA